jgi:hypothetical protein
LDDVFLAWSIASLEIWKLPGVSDRFIVCAWATDGLGWHFYMAWVAESLGGSDAMVVAGRIGDWIDYLSNFLLGEVGK